MLENITAKDRRTKYPLALKLVVIVSALFVAAFFGISAFVWIALRAGINDRAVQDNNIINIYAVRTAQSMLRSHYANALMLDTALSQEHAAGLDGRQTLEAFFRISTDVAALVYINNMDIKNMHINSQFMLANEIEPSSVETYIKLYGNTVFRQNAENIQLINAKTGFYNLPILIMRINLTESAALLVFLSAERRAAAFTADANISVLINNDGEALIQNNTENAAAQDAEAYIETRRQTGIGGSRLVTSISRTIVHESINETTKRNIYLSITVWSLCLLLLTFCIHAICRQLTILKNGVRAIEEGRYQLELPITTSDETAILTQSLMRMSNVLGNFERFTNRMIARLVQQGRLDLEGVYKKATLFFSDIRAFTAFSTTLNAGDLLDFVNEYMEYMTSCIIAAGGAVDKFIGDAIMAHWGAVQSSGEAEDALNAVIAALMTRAALASFNARSGHNIRVGCAINTGTVIAGLVGNEEHLEYTVTGNAVHLADRMEPFNNIFGTETLISGGTWRYVEQYIIAEQMPSIDFYGKKVSVFAMVNIKNKQLEQQILTLLSSLPGIDMDICRTMIGDHGPQTLTDLRLRLNCGAPPPPRGRR
ncbi:MAG: adenylate/guanylate cyclase domain-containing protein, partial [Spirochaetaceae bacterium]|nr:adenylate/guanylate cyclase domain-containing protein [Spirochaetaceae bacterium]